jgi:hypothetical protein
LFPLLATNAGGIFAAGTTSAVLVAKFAAGVVDL